MGYGKENMRRLLLQKTMKKSFLQEALQTLRDCRKYSEAKNMAELFRGAQSLIYYQSYFINELLTAEQEYRRDIQNLQLQGTVDGGKLSFAQSENAARTMENYKKFKYLKYLYELFGEETKLVKKFADKLQDEYKQS